MPKTPMPLEAPELQEISFDLSHMEPYREYIVLLYNDDSHSMEEVTVQLMKALGCGVSRAHAIMFEAHSKGTATVIIASETRARRVASILREIDLKVTVRQVN